MSFTPPPIWEGLNEALCGFMPINGTVVAVYNYDKAVQVFMDMGMDYEAAVEYLEFNVIGSHIGEQTPIWAYSIDDLEQMMELDDSFGDFEFTDEN